MKHVLTNSRFILEKCVGCKTCTHVCPTKAYAPSLDRPLDKKKIAPCSAQCPIGNDIEGFVTLVGQQRYLEAYTLLLETNPLPGITGRVCHHPCEQSCNRLRFDEDISIQTLERFVADHAMQKGYEPARPNVVRKQAVGIIGSGPAGLSCAFHLARLGYRATLFEAAGQAGGMLRFGIPEYRLPKNVLDWEIRTISSLNVDIRVNQRLGDNLSFKDLEDFDALFISIGSWKGRLLGLEGEKASGIWPALDFLKRVNEGGKVSLGKRVAVIGGGNSAVDAARCALRLGSRPVILYRRSIDEMPALSSERRELKEEGIEILPFVTPNRIVTDGGRVQQIELLKTRPGEVAEDGRRIPVPIEGSQFSIEIDDLIVAAGELPELSGLATSLRIREERLVIDSNGQTSRERIFAGGDVATGAGTVSEAIASGKRGAMAIHRFLEKEAVGEGDAPKSEVVKFEEMNPDYFYPAVKPVPGHLDSAQAVRSFDEVCLGYPEGHAIEEAKRCFGCAAPPVYHPEDCRGCINCAERCPASAITIEPCQRPFTVAVDPSQFNPDEILRICKKAKVHPKQIICYCTNTTAGEIAAAILKGARTPEAVSLMTGARTGCTVLCVQSIIKLLEASGNPVTVEGEGTHQCYGKTFTVWDVDASLKDHYEKQGYHFDDDIRLIEKVFENK